MSRIEEAEIHHDSKEFFMLTKRLDKSKRSCRNYPLEIEPTRKFYEALGECKNDIQCSNNEVSGRAPKPTVAEIKLALTQLKRGKASSDQIEVELLQDGGKTMLSALEILFGICYERAITPSDFNGGALILLHKKGSKTEPGNYRGITLMNMVAKLYSKVILNRLAPTFEQQFARDEQGGFRSKRSTEDQCFALQEIAWKLRREKRPLYLLFVDFAKAFDTVNRNLLWQKLRGMGVDGNLIRAIRSLYEGHNAKIRLNGEESAPFQINLGVKQGCVLSPELFKIFINDLIESIHETDTGVKLDFTTIASLMFADDLVMMSETLEGLKQQVKSLESWCSRFKMHANISKTKVMILNTMNKHSDLTLNGEKVEVVPEYQYLGLTFRDNLQWSNFHCYLMNKVKSRIASLQPIFLCKSMSIKARLTLYKSLLCPIFRYGAGVWQLTEKQLLMLERQQLRALRMILRCPMTTTTSAIYADTGISPVRYQIDSCFLQFAGRLITMDKDRLVSKVLFTTQNDNTLSPWGKRLQHLLAEYGLEELHCKLLSTTITRTEWKAEIEETVWERRCKDLQSKLDKAVKCSHLRSDCSRKCPAEYLSLRPASIASFFFQLRAGSLPLEIEQGRRKKCSRSERVCEACHLALEDVKHFMLDCPNLTLERKQLQEEVGILRGVCTSDECGDDDQLILKTLGAPKEGGFQLIHNLYDMWLKRCKAVHLTSSATVPDRLLSPKTVGTNLPGDSPKGNVPHSVHTKHSQDEYQ
jgi:hypothetical protein